MRKTEKDIQDSKCWNKAAKKEKKQPVSSSATLPTY